MWRQTRPSASGLTSPFASQRRQALKGVLVLLMFVYHAMSIASQAPPQDFRLLRFVTGSFIFLSGWSLGTQWAASLWPSTSPTSSPPPVESHLSTAHRGLMRRGLQLLLLFTALNLMIFWSGWGHPDKQVLVRQLWPHPLDRAWAALVLGQPAAASFSILWPLGWLWVSMGCLHRLGRRGPAWIWPFGLAGVGLTVTRLAPVANASGVLDMLLIGWIAAGCAAIVRGWTQDFKRQRLSAPGSALWATASVGVGLWLTTEVPESLTLYVIAMACILKGLHDLVFVWYQKRPRVGRFQPLQTALMTLGRMSLWAYVAQIVMIQAFRWGMGGARWPLNPQFWMGVVLGALVLWASCDVVERLRHQHRAIDTAYRWVFP